MFKKITSMIPEEYRIHVFLVVTSIVGIILILIAVYNASRELELMHDIDNMHGFASALLKQESTLQPDLPTLSTLSGDEYRVITIHDDELMTDELTGSGSVSPLRLSDLNASRINERGGHVELQQQLFTWAMLPESADGERLLIMHRFSYTGIHDLVLVYTKRLLVPALLYIWLMVWLGYIIRFLTHKLSKQKQAMEHLALHDTLTGLPNRNLLNDRLERMMDVAKRDDTCFTVVMIDLDGFKNINDNHGHAIGDALLREVAVRLTSCLRPNDTVCRLGGDEFILLLSDMRDDSSLDICKRISDEISRPVVTQGKHLEIGSSMGVVKYLNHADSSDMLLRKADSAMYEIKAKGGGIFVYDESASPKNATSTGGLDAA